MDIRWSVYDDNIIEVFYEDGADPEIYTVNEFVTIHGKGALPERNEQKDKCADCYYEYWAAALELINAWAKYQGKKKLYINNVENVIVRYYGGDVSRLLRHEHSLITRVNRALADFRCQCRIYKVDLVNIVWLGLHLQEDRHYKSLRGKCQRRKDRNRPPVPIYELL